MKRSGIGGQYTVHNAGHLRKGRRDNRIEWQKLQTALHIKTIVHPVIVINLNKELLWKNYRLKETGIRLKEN